MGKQRGGRRKLHLAAKTAPPSPPNKIESSLKTDGVLQSLVPEKNIFEGLEIDVSSLNKNLTVTEDLQSVKSFKSVKSEAGNLSKKNKLKLRREIFLKKFAAMSQLANEKKLVAKRKSTPIVGDLNPLHDALPSLDSLLKSRNILCKPTQPRKVKGIEKLGKQKKNQLQGIKIYQQVLKNKQYQKNPTVAISQHVKAMLEREKSS